MNYNNLKKSGLYRKHYLTCEPHRHVAIYDAWDLFGTCWYIFSINDLNHLKDKCNGKFSCSYERRNRKGYCFPWYYETKSFIRYYCKHYNSIEKTSTPITMSSSKTTKVTAFTESDTTLRTSTISNKHSTSTGMINTTTPVLSTMSPLQAQSNKSKDAVIAGSVIGVFGVLALVLLLIFFVLKRRKADRNKDTRSGSVTNTVSQNSNVLYVVSDNGSSIPGHPVDEPPAYHSLDHIYINDDYRKNKDLNHQDTDNYNHIHGIVTRKSLRNDDYNHTDTEAVNVSGRQRDEYNHIAVDGQSADVPTVMEDDYNHIKSTEGGVSHGIGKYNHIGGLTDGEENKGYMEDDYNHLDNSDLQNTSKRELAGNKDGQRMQNSNMSKLENNYDNIDRKGGNNDGDDFEPDDTYVYT